MKRRVNVRTLRKLNGLHVDARDAMDEIGRVAEEVRRSLGVGHDEETAKDHIMDFCSGTLLPGDLLDRLGIGLIHRAAIDQPDADAARGASNGA